MPTETKLLISMAKGGWSPDEKESFKACYPDMLMSELCDMFPNRSKPAIYTLAQKLGLKKNREEGSSYVLKLAAQLEASLNAAPNQSAMLMDRRYRERHRDKVRAGIVRSSQRRRAAMRNSPREPIDFSAIVARDRSMCGICRLAVHPSERSFDHIVPLSRGGSHTMANLQLAHTICNKRRNAGRIPAQTRLQL